MRKKITSRNQNHPSMSFMVRTKDRRVTPRNTALNGSGHLTAEVRVGSFPPTLARVVNISRNGTLLEFSKSNTPRVRVDEPITVKLWIQDDVVWLPGVVRHCYAKRMGVFFPRGLGKSIPNARQIISKMLRSTEARRPAPQAG